MSLDPALLSRAQAVIFDAYGTLFDVHSAVARHAGLRVAAVSAITNLAEGMSEEPLSHEQTLRDAARAVEDLAPLVTRFVERQAE